MLMYVYIVANRLEPRSCPTYEGPDLGSSLFALDTVLHLNIVFEKMTIFKMLLMIFSRLPFIFPVYNGFNPEP